MPTLEDYLSNKQQYPDEQKVVLADGVETTLGQLRGGFMKEADYRKKTSDVARQREKLEQERSDFEAARYDAEAKLSELAQTLLAKKPDATRDEVEEALERDPVAKRLNTSLAKMAEKLESIEKRSDEALARSQRQEQTRLTDQHRMVLAAIKQHDPTVDVEELVNFAKDNMVPRLDHAYRLMTYERTIETREKAAAEKATKEATERVKRDLSQPVLPSRRMLMPSQDAPKSFDEAAERALQDSEIISTMMGPQG